MAKSIGAVEINGNRYNAASGQVMGAVKKVAEQVKNPASGVIDGFSRQPLSAMKKTAHSASKAASVRRQVQRSQTLMRNAVSKPTTVDKKSAQSSKLYKSRTADVSPSRLSHAKTVAKHAKVEHFGKLQASLTPKNWRSPAKSTPAPQAPKSEATVKSVAPALPSMVTSASHARLERMLDHALTHASSHKKTQSKAKNGLGQILAAPKWLSMSAGVLALLLLAGFFAWQNIPQVSMRVASAKAHVSASVPAYVPMGYAFTGPAKADSNQVTISYQQSGNSAHQFAISQEASNWDSSSVGSSAVPAGSQVQSSQVNGTTVYIYGAENDAKWVNHGVLFSLKDQASLSSDQILKIAGGL